MAAVREPDGEYIQAGNVKIHYHEFGNGYPLICIHGAGPGASGWSNFKGNVEAFAKQYRTILFDMPQFGKSDKPVIKDQRLAFVADVLNGFMTAVGIERAHFIGNSMGGQAALKLAIDHPNRVDKVVVIGSGVIKAGSIFQPMPLEGIRNIANYYKDCGPSIAKMRQLLESLVSNKSLITDELVQERFEASNAPELIALAKHGAPGTEDLYFDLLKVQAKTLIVWGQDDRAGALDVGLFMLRRLPDARMHIFPRCGHWAHVEYRDEFNQIVLNFLQDS
ncbi:MAG TPA: alpha/beta hydrolase [Candidatus Binatia bacterium]|nr:alpha/beta hydrolase [Candidatus Binatia bacterium]